MEKTWLTDANGNRCSVEYWGSRETGKKDANYVRGMVVSQRNEIEALRSERDAAQLALGHYKDLVTAALQSEREACARRAGWIEPLAADAVRGATAGQAETEQLRKVLRKHTFKTQWVCKCGWKATGTQRDEGYNQEQWIEHIMATAPSGDAPPECTLCEAEQPLAQDRAFHDMGGGVLQICRRSKQYANLMALEKGDAPSSPPIGEQDAPVAPKADVRLRELVQDALSYLTDRTNNDPDCWDNWIPKARELLAAPPAVTRDKGTYK